VAAAVAVAAAIWAVAGSAVLFPHLSDNNDEAVYLLQADALREGRWFPPAGEPAAAFRPWLSADADVGYVAKYSPVHPLIIAGAHRALGSDRAALALIAAGTVAACYLLAREVLASRSAAVLAAAFLAASPLFLVLSATFLGYISCLGLLMGFAAALLAGVRLRSRAWLALSGLLLGLAVFARPFDAVLFGVPMGGWWLWSGRGSTVRRRVREAGWIGLGAALPLVAMAAYFLAATGSVLRPPFTLLDPSDTLGFGPRRMFPAQAALDYTPWRAMVGVGRLAGLTGFWTFGGLLMVGLVVGGLRRRRDREPAATGTPAATGAPGAPSSPPAGPWLALIGLTVPLGYAFFWGSYGSTEWGGPWRFGPFYWFGILAPVSVLGAAGFRRLWRWDRLVAGFAAVGMTVVSAYVLARAAGAHQEFTAERERLYAGPLQAVGLERAVVFLPQLQGPWLLQPFALARNASFDAPVLWALDRGERRNLEVLHHLPGRTPYRVVAHGARTDRPPNLGFTTSLERLTAVNGRLLPPGGDQ
jgi:4-amino-4-deoxy-L-arabinose transferase-like glycosyltransferase